VIEHVEKRHRELVDKIEQPKQPRDGKDPQPRPEPQQRDAE
jgi:hypothetical protein